MADEIDNEFPFLQVHRSVGAKAASLSARVGVTYQHARGALDIFWEGLADRRLLRGIPELVLTEDDVRTRLELAFGKPVEPALMVSLKFLELRRIDDGKAILDGFKVCGMDRYIVAEATRLKKKGTPAARRIHPGPTEGAPEFDPFSTPVPPGSHPGPTGIAPEVPLGSHPTEGRGKRKEGRGESEEFTGDAFFAWTQDTRVDLGAVREAPPARGLSAWFSLALMECGGDLDRIRAGWLAYLEDPYWRPRKNPWAGWLRKWRECVPAKPIAAAPLAPPCCVCGGKGGCGSAAVPLCLEHAQEATEWCAGQRIDAWEAGGLEKWNEQRLRS